MNERQVVPKVGKRQKSCHLPFVGDARGLHILYMYPVFEVWLSTIAVAKEFQTHLDLFALSASETYHSRRPLNWSLPLSIECDRWHNHSHQARARPVNLLCCGALLLEAVQRPVNAERSLKNTKCARMTPQWCSGKFTIFAQRFPSH